jgi:4-hydroxy-2-oxoheptanedioate aldolase
MELPTNRLKAALARGDVQTGLWLTLADPAVAEIAGRAGFDWCLIDAEHGPNTPTTIQAQLQALEAAGCPAVVRVAANDPVRLKLALDLGAQSVLVPLVDTAEEAAAAVAACRYPPRGMRGMGAAVARASYWGRVGDYAARADGEICVIVQAESRRALARVAEIAAVEGVDGVFIGPADLSADMGHPGAPDHPEVRAAIEAGLGAIAAAGAAPGIIAFDPEAAAGYARLGARFLGLGADAAALSGALGRLSAAARAALAP